jgi:hypothetical protein
MSEKDEKNNKLFCLPMFMIHGVNEQIIRKNESQRKHFN